MRPVCESERRRRAVIANRLPRKSRGCWPTLAWPNICSRWPRRRSGRRWRRRSSRRNGRPCNFSSTTPSNSCSARLRCSRGPAMAPNRLPGKLGLLTPRGRRCGASARPWTSASRWWQQLASSVVRVFTLEQPLCYCWSRVVGAVAVCDLGHASQRRHPAPTATPTAHRVTARLKRRSIRRWRRQRPRRPGKAILGRQRLRPRNAGRPVGHASIPVGRC